MKAIQRNTFIKRAAFACGALVACGTGAATLSAPAAFAQSAPQGEIVIPDDVKIFGNDNPNLRRATAVVNGAVITGTDVDQRLALILAANQGKISEEEQKRLRLQVLRNLIDETLQIQEAKAAEVSVDDAEIEQSYARVAAQNFNQNTQAMDAYLKRVGSSPDSLKRQIRGELSWQRLLQRNVQPFINVSDDEVNEVIDRLKASKGTEEYRLGEIYLAATPETEQQVEGNANQIMQQLRQGGSFVAYARQYSQASTASVGGDLGWVRLGQLPGEVATAVRDMQPGQLGGPIAIPGGYDIVYLIDKRQVLTADPRDAVLALKQISIEFPKGLSEAQANAKAESFAKTIQTAKGCGDVDKVAATIGAQVVANDQVKARDLPGPIQSSILNLSPGETLPPFGSLTEGVRILMLCGRDDPQVDSGPNFEQVMAQLEDDRVNKRAQMYLRDLRRDAVIEYN
ncbi:MULTISPECIES: peptidylprolyl isomerase [Novosphingobium]|uniref:Parvulin-like PPIase n=1 Tax=Novosphingobium pentaromativorans TaxID=205844 RepID=A0A2W5NRC8_9SPHN|nr:MULTISPECIES: peptidylprolyl isomerase [Novosphingobium]PZQ56092.1 MAG: peptidylprolyl isomerase [Novosphingobium pentaromativorans]GFE74341.1 chaperone SurA [Novosphingobium sp. TCA1]